MRIAVLGAGGLGGYFGGRLARAGHEVTFIARGAQLAALARGELEVRSVHGDFRARVRATDDPRTVGTVELLLFLVKTYDTESAARAALPLADERTTVLTLQNGVDNAERITAALGRGVVLRGLAYIEAAAEAPGVFGQYSPAQRVLVGEGPRGGVERVDGVVASLREAGVDAAASDDIVRDLWTKWAFICAMAGTTTVTRQPLGAVLGTPQTRELFLSIVREVEAVGRASGVALAADLVERSLRSAEALGPGAKSSMLRDAERGRPLEVEAFSGRVAAYGAELGVATPANAFICAALLPAHRAALAARSSLAAQPQGAIQPITK